jgi:hypothetical protein
METLELNLKAKKPASYYTAQTHKTFNIPTTYGFVDKTGVSHTFATYELAIQKFTELSKEGLV